ncbi:MAG: hypothetical protein ACRD0U_15460 [Acidimicrobiales bacterium]
MRLRRIMATVAAAAAVAVGTGGWLGPAGSAPAQAGPEPVEETSGCRFGQWPDDVNGRPAELEAGAATGLYLWHGEDGWGAAVTHPGHRPVRFEVVVRSSGRIYAVERRTERRDDVDVSADFDTARLHALNWGWIDGMAFRTACAKRIVVSGSIDGVPIAPDQVFLGRHGVNPTGTPVLIERS